MKGRQSPDHQPTAPFCRGKLSLREIQWPAWWLPAHERRINSTLPWKQSLELFMHRKWTKQDEAVTLRIQTPVRGFQKNIRENTGSKGRSQGTVYTLVGRVSGTELIWLGCSCIGFQRLWMWDTELKRHSRSAPICLDDNLQPSSTKGHCLQGKALPTDGCKDQTCHPGLDTDTMWMETNKRAEKAKSVYS